jgi:excisionase family DNA binding protein
MQHNNAPCPRGLLAVKESAQKLKMSADNSRQLFSVKTAAQEYGVHENSIRNWILEGRLKAVRIGAHIVRIEAAELAKLSTPYVGGEYSPWNRA